MEKKILIIIFSVVLISFTPQVFADEDLDALLAEKNGVLIEQQKIIFEVGKYSDVHVKHIIETGAWSHDRPRVIEILPGIHSDLKIADEDGDSYGTGYDGLTFEDSRYIILKQKLGNYDLIVEYDLEKFMKLDNGLWKKEISLNQDVFVMFEDDIEFIFANSRPVDVSDAKGINCIGCLLTLEYINDENISTEEILSNEEKFELEILSNEEIFDIEFIEGGNQIERVTQLLNFDVRNMNQIYILKIPHEKFLNPYDVYFTEKDDTSLDQLDKIRKTEFSQDETHVKLSFRTFGEGTISIVGATPEEHEKKIEQIQDIKSREVKSEKVDEKKSGIAVPIPGTKAASELAAQMSENNNEQTETLSFANELKQDQRQNSEDDITIIGIIAGIIAAVIIAGIVLKLKKN